MTDMLLVAVCGGPRCSALRRMHDPSADEAGTVGRQLRDAVRSRSNSVLVVTGCLGPCDQGCVVAVGPATDAADPGGGTALRWTRHPIGLGLVERPDRSTELAGWVQASAPDPGTLPVGLRA